MKLLSGMALASVSGAALACATMAAAQDAVPPVAPAPPPTLGDSIVTAQRRAQPLQSVPMAVTALPAATLATLGVTTTLGVADYVPNMTASNSVGLTSANTYYLRGLGNADSFATFNPAVGTFIDDIPLARQTANNFSFFDLDRIEVLRGPQGTLRGRNTTGGAINVILAKPSETLGGYLDAGYGAYGKVEARASIDLPVSKQLAVKLSGYYQRDGGYARNTTTGQRSNGTGASGLRAAVRFDLTDQLSWNTSLSYLRDTGANLPDFTCDPNHPAKCDGRFTSTGLLKSYDIAHPSPFVALGITGRKANFGLGNTVDTLIYASNLAWQGDGYRLSLITGLVDTKQKSAIDLADGRTPLPSVAVPVPAAHGLAVGYDMLTDASYSQVSQEAKLDGTLLDGRLDYVTGVAYVSEDNRTDFADIVNLGGTAPGTPLVLADRTARTHTDAVAGYAQVDVHATSALRITGGIRFTDERQTFGITDNRTGGGFGLPGSVASTQHSKLWTPRVAVDYQLPGVLLFASASRGYRSGGWNARATTPAALLPFGPERAWSYEAGAKTEFFDHRLRANLTAFWLDAQNTPTTAAQLIGGLPTFTTQNAAGLRNRGVELELTARPTPRVNLFANLGYQHARYRVGDGATGLRAQQLACQAELAARRVPLATDANAAPDCAAGIVDANGGITRPVRSPDFTASAGASYDYPIPAAGIIVQPSVTIVYSSSFETGAANDTLFTGAVTGANGTVYPANPFGGSVISGSRTNAYTLVNAALALQTDDNNWTLSLECRNCFDKAYAQSEVLDYRYLNAPRTWLVRAKRVF